MSVTLKWLEKFGRDLNSSRSCFAYKIDNSCFGPYSLPASLCALNLPLRWFDVLIITKAHQVEGQKVYSLCLSRFSFVHPVSLSTFLSKFSKACVIKSLRWFSLYLACWYVLFQILILLYPSPIHDLKVLRLQMFELCQTFILVFRSFYLMDLCNI